MIKTNITWSHDQKLLLAYGLNAKHTVNWDVDSEYGILDFLLGYAVKENFQSRVALLLERGANPASRDYYNGKTDYEKAIAGNNLQLVNLLREYPVKKWYQNNQIIKETRIVSS